MEQRCAGSRWAGVSPDCKAEDHHQLRSQKIYREQCPQAIFFGSRVSLATELCTTQPLALHVESQQQSRSSRYHEAHRTMLAPVAVGHLLVESKPFDFKSPPQRRELNDSLKIVHSLSPSSQGCDGQAPDCESSYDVEGLGKIRICAK